MTRNHGAITHRGRRGPAPPEEPHKIVLTSDFLPPASIPISYDMWLALHERMSELAGDDEVRCIVFRGAGGEAFSAGADIKDFPEHRYDSRSARAYGTAIEAALDAIDEIPKPTISMIEGFCVGGGLELASATDIRIAAHGSRYGIPVARLGITAGFKEMRRVVRLVGAGNASFIALSGELIDADHALRIGLLTDLVEVDALEDRVYGLARRMSELAPISHADHKEIIRTVSDNPGLTGMTDKDFSLQYRVFDTEDFKEGMAAFVEKRNCVRFRGEALPPERYRKPDRSISTARCSCPKQT